MYEELLAKIDNALDIMKSEVGAMRAELVADPTLVEGEYWRDRLEMFGYQAYTLLSTEDD